LERGKKDRRKKIKTQANWEEKGHDRSQLDTKCQEFGYGHFVKLLTFCVTIGHTDSVLVPAKQTKQQQAQAAETNLTRM
jgi:hypothetical protein